MVNITTSMSDEYVITQDGNSALMRAAGSEAVVELVKAGANIHLQDKVGG